MEMAKKMFGLGILIAIIMLSGCQTAQNITIMSYNIHHGQGTDGKLDLDRIASIIEKSQAGLVILNEVDNNYSGRSNNEDQGQVLADKLRMNHVFGPGIITGDPAKPNLYGNAILSKFPIKSSKTHKLPGPGEPRCCLEAEIELPGGILTVFATHLEHSKSEARSKQANEIMRLVEKCKTPLIVAGDMNATPTSETIAVYLQKLFDTEQLANSKVSSITIKDNRAAKIDYIFVSTDLVKNVKSYNVIDNDVTAVASDHFPIKSIVKIPSSKKAN
ncbi:MAG: endonuclease/exonuclease/phosphatase family protein [Phycisphaerae bacterium]|nr:endonuclease/exonuclease/phosphatase family protein [Phycisphaerae bacterium]